MAKKSQKAKESVTFNTALFIFVDPGCAEMIQTSVKSTMAHYNRAFLIDAGQAFLSEKID